MRCMQCARSWSISWGVRPVLRVFAFLETTTKNQKFPMPYLRMTCASFWSSTFLSHYEIIVQFVILASYEFLVFNGPTKVLDKYGL